jgi:DNA-binding winged helix-turn-helix (wHTH) protein/tetratricopeptide (TPR) repeat protein
MIAYSGHAMEVRVLAFPPFQLDLDDERLLRDGSELKLRRKPFAILKYLATHPKRLVTHQEVTEAIWGNISMSENVLRTHVYELRNVVGEGVIETVIGRGYRFVSNVRAVERLEPLALVRDLAAESPRSSVASSLVGRERELALLRGHLQGALKRRRQVAFITGEPGIGKTSLMDAVLDEATATGALVARGSCVEQYGSGEAYLPVLSALSSACRGSRGRLVVEVLGRHAPTWLIQMPGLVPDDKLAAIQGRVQGATQTRMLRELAEALEILSGDIPFVLALDDLHWADNSTAELLALLAHRREPTRLFVIGTCRQMELPKTHALSRVLGELAAHREAATLQLGGLAAAAVGDYIAARWPGSGFSHIAQTIHDASNGNPLFMVALLEDLESRQMVRLVEGKWQLLASLDDMRAWRPDSVRQLIDVQIDRLEALDQRILEAAAAAGADFTVGAVAHALEASVDDVDARCESMVEQGRFLRHTGAEAWADGTIQTRYAFVHALHQHAANARNPTAVTRAWHRRIGERLEAGYGAAAAANIAAELATHYDAGHNLARAAHYYELAGTRADRRTGGVEAVGHFERARDLLARLPETAGRDRLELEVLRKLGRATITLNALENAQLISTFTRAAHLARRLHDDRSLASALIGLQQCRMMQGSVREVEEHAGELEEVTRRLGDPAVASWGLLMSSAATLFRGHLEPAHSALADGARRVHEAAATSPQPEAVSFPYAPLMFSNLALAEWLLGRPDTALVTARESVTLAEALEDPFTLSLALAAAGAMHMWRREWKEAIELGRRGSQVASDSGSALGLARNGCVYQLASVELGTASADAAFHEIEKLLTPNAPLGGSGPSHYALTFVEVAVRAGKIDRALVELSNALTYAEEREQRVWEAELHRVRGEILKATDRKAAEQSFLRAIALARHQSSRSLELRAALSLHRFAIGPKKREWQDVVRRLYDSVGEGRSTGDLVDAKRVIDDRTAV